MNVDLHQLFVLLAVTIPSIILHEVSHGAAAYAFGDDTAKRAGRLTLNPVSHVDPFGTILLPLLTIAAGFGAFGYAKPVPVNPGKMRSPRNHNLLTALAGPATNLLLALVLALVLRLAWPDAWVGSLWEQSLLLQVLVMAGIVNVILAVFNLVPLPPLDGSAVVERFLPHRLWPGYMKLRRWSMPILIAIVLIFPGVFGGIIGWAIDQWASLVWGR